MLQWKRYGGKWGYYADSCKGQYNILNLSKCDTDEPCKGWRLTIPIETRFYSREKGFYVGYLTEDYGDFSTLKEAKLVAERLLWESTK